MKSYLNEPRIFLEFNIYIGSSFKVIVIMIIILLALQASKETLADVYNNITLANAQHVANITLVNVQNTATGVGNTISAGVDTTITISTY